MGIASGVSALWAALLVSMPGPGSIPAPTPVLEGDSVYRAVRPVMGTTAEIRLVAASAEAAAELFEEAFAEIERLDAALSTYRPTSELSRLNALASEGPVTTDPETFALLEAALGYSRLTGGAFDISVGALVKAWGFFGGEGRYPTAASLAEARARTGWKRVVLERGARTVRFTVPGLELDPGGIGKGWALDRAAAVLRDLGAGPALLGLGGSTFLAVGAPPGAEGWVVHVPDPRATDSVLATIRLRDRALSTSGSSGRFFVHQGRRYGHVLDPRTGHPVTGTLQTTVLASTATEADALSTAVLVLGPDASQSLLETTPGVSALLVTERPEAGIVALGWPVGIGR